MQILRNLYANFVFFMSTKSTQVPSFSVDQQLMLLHAGKSEDQSCLLSLGESRLPGLGFACLFIYAVYQVLYVNKFGHVNVERTQVVWCFREYLLLGEISSLTPNHIQLQFSVSSLAVLYRC